MDGAENAEVEFKSAKGGLPESFWESFSSFANTNGGIIVLGIKEKNGKFIPDGLTSEQITTYKKRFWDCAHNKEKVSATMLTERDVIEGDTDGNKFLAFRIPRASYDIRPVYLTRNPFGNTFKRNHEGDYHCTDNEVREMFADAHHISMISADGKFSETIEKPREKCSTPFISFSPALIFRKRNTKSFTALYNQIINNISEEDDDKVSIPSIDDLIGYQVDKQSFTDLHGIREQKLQLQNRFNKIYSLHCLKNPKSLDILICINQGITQ